MARRPALIALLRHREPALLLSGQTISNFGDGVALVALTLLVLDTTHSASKLAWFAAARMIPLVGFILVGGAVVDRISRRTLMLISDASRAVLSGVVVVLLVAHALHYWELIVFAVTFGAFDAVFMPAFSALTPEIVPEELLPAMNAARPLTTNLMGNMIGPAVGGVLAAASTSWAIGVDSATFVLSAAALVAMHATPTPVRTEGTSMLEEIRVGLRYVRATNWIWTTLAAVTLVNAFVFMPMSVLVPYFLKDSLHLSSVYVGYAFAVFGAAGTLGALVASNLKTPARRIRVMWSFWLVGTVSALVFAVATNFYVIMIFPIVASPCMVLGNVIWESMMQALVPRDLLGRVSSVDWFTSLGLAPVGLVVAGALAGVLGVRTYFVIASVVTALPGAAIVVSRRVNAIDHGRVNPAAVGAPSPTTEL